MEIKGWVVQPAAGPVPVQIYTATDEPLPPLSVRVAEEAEPREVEPVDRNWCGADPELCI